MSKNEDRLPYIKMSNHEIGCDLEALANVMEYRGYFEHAMKLREIASVIK